MCRAVMVTGLVFMASTIGLQASVRLAGDITDEQAQESFSFPIKPHVFQPRFRQLIVGARDPVTNSDAQPFAISSLEGDRTQFASLAPETVTLNNVSNQSNPLHGAAIRFLDAIEAYPVAVTESAANQVTVTILQGVQNILVLRTNPLQDGNGADARDIIGLHVFGNSFAAAVRPSGDDFGASGAGIAFGTLDQDSTSGNLVLQQQTSMFQTVQTDRAELLQNGRELTRFNNDENQPVVFTPLPSGGDATGFSVVSGSDSDAGARSIIVGRDNVVIPEAALKPDAIVGTDQPDTSVFVHTLDAIVTSTTLPYLIVHGGVGDADTTRRRVSALPLVNAGDGSSVGIIAARDVEPEPRFEQQEPFRFRGLGFTQAADTPARMWTSSDEAVQIGGGRDAPGAITDVWTEKDAVFVAIPEIDSGAELPAGIYYSQALFNAHGRIIGWTEWMPTADTAAQAIEGVAFDAASGQYTVFQRNATGDVDTVARTQVTQQVDALQSISQEFAEVSGGIQGGNDIPFNNPALADTSGDRMSLFIATGLNTVVLAQVARDVSGVLTPVDDINLVKQDNAQIMQTPADGYIVQGGDLDNIGAIITSDIGTDGNFGWLVVGGSDGLAVLRADDGSGWPASGLQAQFANMPNLVFRSISGITSVRKVVIDRGNCYILTEYALYRMPLSQANLAGAIPQIYRIADAQSVCGQASTFSDVVVSGTRGILATSCGLFRVSTGVDIASLVDGGSASWQQFSLPESVGPVTRLYVVSPTHREVDVAKTSRGGAIYAISTSVSLFRTLIYRIAVTPESGVGSPNVDELSLYPDYFTQRSKSYFVSRGDYRNFVFSDGAMWLLSRSRYAPQENPIIVELLPSQLRAGVPLIAVASTDFFDISPPHRVNQPERVSSRGGLLLHGDFGIYMQR